METINKIINRRGLIRVEHSKHGSRAFLWLDTEMERLFGFEGKNTKALGDFVRPYCCVICSQLCAMPNRSCEECEEKKGMGAEWTMYRQTHTEIWY